MFTRPIPKNAVKVGTIIEEEYRKPLGFTQQALADRLGISRVRYAEIASGKRSITISTASRLGQVFRTSPQFWLNMQAMYDLSEAAKSPEAAEIAKLKPIAMEAPGAEAIVIDGALQQKLASVAKAIKVSGPSPSVHLPAPAHYAASAAKKSSASPRSAKKASSAKGLTMSSGKRK